MKLKLKSVLIAVIIIRMRSTHQRPMWLEKAVRERSQGLAWVFGLKPHCWVQARGAVIPTNYSQGIHQDSHWQGSHLVSSLFQTTVSLISFLIFTQFLCVLLTQRFIFIWIILFETKTSSLFFACQTKQYSGVQFLAASHGFCEFDELMPHVKSRSSKLRFKP